MTELRAPLPGPHVSRSSTVLSWAACLVLIYAVALPLASHQWVTLGAHDTGRIAQLVVLPLCVLALVASQLRRSRLRPMATGSPFDRPLGAVIACTALLLALASIMRAAEPAHAWRELCLLIGLAAAAACVAKLPVFEPRWRWCLVVLVTGASLYALSVFGIAAAAIAGGSQLIAGALFFGYDNYRFYNHVQTVSLPLLAIVCCAPWLDRRWRVMAGGGLVMGFAVLLLGVGRATSLGFIAGSALSLLLLRRAALPFVTCLTAGAVLGAMAYALLTIALPAWFGTPTVVTLHQLSSTASYDARQFVWQLALGDIRESPWLGIGPMHFAHRVNVEAAHPHNIYLQVAAEWGLPLFALLLATAGWALWRLRMAILACGDARERHAGAGLLATCIAVAVDGIFSGNFVMPVSQMWIVVLAGLCIAWCRAQTAASASRLSPPRRLGGAQRLAGVVALAAVASQVWLLADAYPEARSLTAHLQRVQRELAPNPQTNPRFWSHGWF